MNILDLLVDNYTLHTQEVTGSSTVSPTILNSPNEWLHSYRNNADLPESYYTQAGFGATPVFEPTLSIMI